MKISLIHPSRGRSKKALDTLHFWIENSSKTIEIEHLLSIDFSDDEKHNYQDLFKLEPANNLIVCADNNSVVQATNYACKFVTGDILIYLSDDFKCPKNWDLSLVEIFNKTENPMLLKVDDCLQKFEVAVLTIPIMNSQLFYKLGYFWHPEYKSMFVDEDLFWTCKNNNWLSNAEHLKFPHEHVCNGLAENDETYKRSAANWDSGKATYLQRKSLNFPL